MTFWLNSAIDARTQILGTDFDQSSDPERKATVPFEDELDSNAVASLICLSDSSPFHAARGQYRIECIEGYFCDLSQLQAAWGIQPHHFLGVMYRNKLHFCRERLGSDTTVSKCSMYGIKWIQLRSVEYLEV